MKLCIIGTGYVGLVSGTCFADIGNNVICVDVDRNKIQNLNSGIIPIYEPGLEEMVKRNINQERLKFSYDVNEAIKKSDIIFICVGTPTIKKTNSVELKYVYQVANKIKSNLDLQNWTIDLHNSVNIRLNKRIYNSWISFKNDVRERAPFSEQGYMLRRG